MFQNERVIQTKICKHCGSSFDITDKDLEFYEKVSPVFPNPGVSFSTPGLKQAFPPREKEVEENITLNGGGIKEGAVIPAKAGIYENEKIPSNDSETSPRGYSLASQFTLSSEGQFLDQRPVSSKETSLKDLGNEKVRHLIPSPTLCPDCRQQRRLSFRNERKLYKRKCDATEKNIITMFSPDKPYKVYGQDAWWSDNWDVLDYGRDFDFNRPFFEQFNDILKEIPHFHNAVAKNINSDYVNYSANTADSYLIFASSQNKSCYYCRWVMNSEKLMDSNNTINSEECYYCIDVNNSVGDFYCISCKDTAFCYSSYDLIGCQNCIACSNLRNKQYCIFNEEYSKEKYNEEKEKYKNYETLLKQVLKKSIHKNVNLTNTQNSFGDYLINSKDCNQCFDGEKLENCKYVSNTLDMDSAQDMDFQAFDTHFCYECLGTEYTSNALFSYATLEGSSKVLYSFGTFSSSNIFGCVYVKNKSYCILNKQYTKSEYEALVPKIISHMMKTGEWGEFFPSSLSPFGYNETVAQEYFPINPPVLTDIPLIKGDRQNGVEAGGFYYIDRKGNTYKTLQEAGERPVFKYSTYETPFPKVEKIIPASKLPENITDIPDDILNWAIECEITKKPFKIIPQELDFYRKHNLPIPRRHPDQRHLDRMSLRNPRHLYSRNCDKCGKEIQTTYAPERPEIVYCEECYNKEMY
ncbi:hypothetical protein HGA92_04745 [Candidatus Gracilibacteria bacterium]|nr:hypothetical protein [Candidatus Gracilibacteria bacterium]NUJ98457.1 hypothetical protein [Candidatus Gracilibacteria bacterium]